MRYFPVLRRILLCFWGGALKEVFLYERTLCGSSARRNRRRILPENLVQDNLDLENLVPKNLGPKNLAPENLASENFGPKSVGEENLGPENHRGAVAELSGDA